MNLDAKLFYGRHPGGKQATVYHPRMAPPTVMASPAPTAGHLTQMDGTVVPFAAGDYLVTSLPPTETKVVPRAIFEALYEESR